MMGVPGGDDDVVQIQHGSKPGEPSIITVNCPDKTGLGCDICRIILDFGLCIVKGGIEVVLFFFILSDSLLLILLYTCIQFIFSHYLLNYLLSKLLERALSYKQLNYAKLI